MKPEKVLTKAVLADADWDDPVSVIALFVTSTYFFISLVLVPLNNLLWYVPSSRYIWRSAPLFCFCKNK